MNAVLDHLPILILEPHSRCNCRCVMCDIWKTTDSVDLGADEFARYLAEIDLLGVEWVVFTGGEPLMHAGLFELSGMLRERRVRTTLLSSGLLLERYAGEIVAGMGDVIVSLDGPAEIHNAIRGVPGAFERLRDGVAAIHRLAPSYEIAARCTVQAANVAHLRETVDTARALGLKSISFLAADVTSAAFNRPTPWPETRQLSVTPELSVLESEIEWLIAAGDPFILESPAKLRRIVDHFAGRHRAPRCNAPWVSAVVEANGDLRPCFFHPAVGNIKRDGLDGALNGPRATAFREQLDVASDPTCARCVCSLHREP
jgi:MoaA/NifB/PqqE/SkfB family radical SAM enzyme